MVVQHNISAMTANRYYQVNNKGLASSLEKLASGYAINKAGDNAAGLAVSEKMRAQIGGLTQASKNAEDGISMVQTFEGALQETDSILQRMRTLAVQSANGSYQDDVDRDAIQLEFDQLNDELNQIADTDFNGTVMLNGGVMADGVKAHNGKIDYATKKEDITDSLKKSLKNDFEAATSELNAAKAEYAKGKYDISSNGDAPEWNTLDNSQYNKTAADNLWKDLGITSGTGANVKADTSIANKVEITFKYDGNTKTWKADSASSYLNGEKVKDYNSDALAGANTKIETVDAKDGAAAADATGKGGFTVKSKSNAGVATDSATSKPLGDVVFDNTNITDGSTITLVYTNGDPTKMAPTNIGYNEDSFNKNLTGTAASTITDPVLALDATNVKDSNMTEDIKNALDALDNLNFGFKYNGTADFDPADITVGGKANISTDATSPTAITNNGKTVYASATATGEVTFYADSAGATAIATITAANDAADVAGEITGKISLSKSDYSDSPNVTLSVGDNPNLESSEKATAKVNAAREKLDAVNDKLKTFNSLNKDNAQDWEKIKTMYAESQSSSGNAVSISDNFDNSRSKMTYTDSMSLQVGARTKDSVNFTFDYACDDLGGLEKNLNCSAREGGLETAKLSLRTQESANDAIDKIDKALNKVNMVRATFGAVQNRLEHKINNIDTNTENITAAESRIRDTQMDKEMMKFTSSQILSQASQSMLAQANQLPQGVLQLLG